LGGQLNSHSKSHHQIHKQASSGSKIKGKRKIKLDIDKKVASVNEEYTNIDIVNEKLSGNSSTLLRLDTVPNKLKLNKD
jgi:hypothetical protein